MEGVMRGKRDCAEHLEVQEKTSFSRLVWVERVDQVRAGRSARGGNVKPCDAWKEEWGE
jgi:hypothetical protein